MTLKEKLEKLKAETPPVAASSFLPAIVNADVFHAAPYENPPEIVAGLLSQGSRMIVGGPSKSRKSWEALSLCYAIATGADWLIWKTTKARVLYINLELRQHVIRKRSDVLRAHRCIKNSPNLDFWNLRAYATDIAAMVDEILAVLENCSPQYGVICIDPLYKLLGDRDENSAGDMTELVSHLEKLAFHTTAAIIVTAHFPKGSMGGRSSLDRISGSGVFGRDADCILTFTPPDKQLDEMRPKFAVDLTVRDFAPVPSFVVQWHYPSFMVDASADPVLLVPSKNGRPPKYSNRELLTLLPKTGLNRLDWQKKADDELGISRSSFLRHFNDLVSAERVTLKPDGLYVPDQQDRTNIDSLFRRMQNFKHV